MPPVEFKRGENQVSVRLAASPEVVKAVEDLPSYIVPTQRKVSQVKRLMKLSRALANDELEIDADETAMDRMLEVLESEFSRVGSSDAFKKLVQDRTSVEVRAVDWQVGLEVVTDDSFVTLEVSDENIDDIFEEAGRRIGDEGIHKAWWKRRRKASVDNTQAKLELVALSVDSAVRKRLETTAQSLVQDWLRAHKKGIGDLPDRRKQAYDELRGQALDPELRDISLPGEVSVTISPSSWPQHMYQDSEGQYPATLNKWETAVLKEELARDGVTWWMRNIPRKPWSLTVPYEVSGKSSPFYPDFLIVRRVEDELVVDILDPHHIELADAPAKALGLAKYAAKHHEAFGRVELIIVKGEDDVRRIDLTDEKKRQRVLEVKTKEHLALLFDEF